MNILHWLSKKENNVGAIRTWVECWLSPFLAMGKCTYPLQQESENYSLWVKSNPFGTKPYPLITYCVRLLPLEQQRWGGATAALDQHASS